MPRMPIVITFDEETLPGMLDGLVRAERSLESTHEMLAGMAEFAEVADEFASAMAAVQLIHQMIDDAVLRAVAESN